MTRDLAYYRRQPYQRMWETREDAGERYFVVRIREFPRIAGDGVTKSEALANLRQAFDDFIAWRIEDELDIPEPSRGAIADLPTIEIVWVDARAARTSDEVSHAMDCWNLGDAREDKSCSASVAESIPKTSQIDAEKLPSAA